MIAAVIQARMGSTRLPGKTLREICGKPLLEHLIERVAAVKLVEQVVVATTNEPRDDVLEEFARQRGLPCYRGSEHDVLDRVYQAAKQFDVHTIVRVTPDCPLLDPRIVDAVMEVFRSGDYDYVANAAPRTYPDGLDVEVFTFTALERAWREARLPSEREHVTPYFRSSGRFRTANVEHPTDLSHLKWSVDTAEDLEFARAVFEALAGGGEIFSMDDVLRVTAASPVLAAINARSVVNEGYYRSLARDPAPPDMKAIVGCKLLNGDLSLNGKCRYPDDGQWHEIPDNGAYVAITKGLDSVGRGHTLAWLECREPTGAPAPEGVVCYRRVRRISYAPDRITPELRGDVACHAPGLTIDQRVAMAEMSTPEWRGRVARDAPGLSPEQRFALAKRSTPEWRGRVANYVPSLTAEQRVALAEASTPELRGWVACYAPGLTAEQRVALAEASTPEWRGLVARGAPRPAGMTFPKGD